MALVYFLIIVSFCTVFGAAVYFYARRHLRRRKLHGSRTALFSVVFSRPVSLGGEDARGIQLEIENFENFLKRLYVLKRQVALEIFVEHVGKDISFCIAAPQNLQAPIFDEIYRTWHGARVEKIHDDFGIFNVHGATIGGYVTQKKHFAFSLLSYKELVTDSFAPILAGFEAIDAIGEGAAMQIVLRPAPHGHKRDVARQMKFVKEMSASDEEKEKLSYALRKRSFRPLFEVNARLVVSAGNRLRAEKIFDSIAAGFNQDEARHKNSLKIIRPRDPSALIEKFVARRFDPRERLVLSGEEIATLIHFPTSLSGVARIRRAGSREVRSREYASEGMLVGDNVFRGELAPIFIHESDRKNHLYITGEKGVGKSALVGNMLIQDMNNGRGVGLIDPDGLLAERMLEHVPHRRLGDVVYLNAGDAGRPVGINVFDHNAQHPEEKNALVSELKNIVCELFPLEMMGPMFEDYIRNALLLLAESQFEPATLFDLVRVFVDKKYRVKKLAHIKNRALIHFWEHEATSSKGENVIARMTPSLISKLGQFELQNPLRLMIGQTRLLFDIRRAVHAGKIIICNLRRDIIGDAGARFAGSLIGTQMLVAGILGDEKISSGARPDFNLYINEFDIFGTGLIGSILSGNQKSSLRLTLTNQSMRRLPKKIKDAVLTGIMSKIAFRVGRHDAETLLPVFKDAFSLDDLISAENLHAHARLVFGGLLAAPFSIRVRTDSWNVGDKKIAAHIKQHSREKYGLIPTDRSV